VLSVEKIPVYGSSHHHISNLPVLSFLDVSGDKNPFYGKLSTARPS
jgi:hypothetical protein